MSVSDNDIGLWIAACARQDRVALARLHGAEAARMIGVAERILKRRALAEEAVQDAFVQLWRKAASFDPSLGSGRTWLYAILRNRCLNILRGESRTELTDDATVFDRPSDDEDAETMVARLDDASRLKACLEKLEPQRRQAIVMAYAEGLSHGELAGRLQIPLGTIKSWIRRGLASLKECLA
jgi:RNA polymerase sigma factor (sigma-70 family)